PTWAARPYSSRRKHWACGSLSGALAPDCHHASTGRNDERKPAASFPVPATPAEHQHRNCSGQRPGGAGQVLFLRTLGTVLGAALLTTVNTGGIQGAAHGVVTHTRQVLHPATTNQDHGVFLQVVTFTTDIGGDFVAIGQTHTADFTQRGVRLLR